MLKRLGFDDRWVGWMRQCLITTRIFVLVNESPSEEFSPQRGLREGSPLAPFLFTVVAEEIRGLMRTAVEKNLFK